ncbi:MAG: adenylosuccinate lyase, partial [Lachnospiraceae bacterium]|nr:adenylosuccinate lyase [Lachnospiraceae bacterium]
ELSMEAVKNVKQEGKQNDLLKRISDDPAFNMSYDELLKTMDPKRYVGRAPYQVEVYLKEVINPMLDANKDLLGMHAEINV